MINLKLCYNNIRLTKPVFLSFIFEKLLLGGSFSSPACLGARYLSQPRGTGLLGRLEKQMNRPAKDFQCFSKIKNKKTGFVSLIVL